MDRDQDDLNEDFKKENIEITGSSKMNPDDEAAGGATDVLGEETSSNSDDGSDKYSGDDELDSDKMDFEDEEKNYL